MIFKIYICILQAWESRSGKDSIRLQRFFLLLLFFCFYVNVQDHNCALPLFCALHLFLWRIKLRNMVDILWSTWSKLRGICTFNLTAGPVIYNSLMAVKHWIFKRKMLFYFVHNRQSRGYNIHCINKPKNVDWNSCGFPAHCRATGNYISRAYSSVLQKKKTKKKTIC